MEKTFNTTSDALLRHGVRKLKILGFSHVTVRTILSNEMYRLYFLKFLYEKEVEGNSDESTSAYQLRRFVEEMMCSI